MNTALITIDTITIKQDEEGRYCLNDLHKAAGGNPNDAPAQWFRNKSYKDLANELFIQHRYADSHIAPMETVKGGLNQGTYVCKELVYAYAMWISPAFHLKVIRAYDRMMTQRVPQPPVVQAGLPDTLLILQQQMQANQQMLQNLIEQNYRTTALERVAETHTKTLEVVVDAQDHIVTKVETLEKDVKFSHNMLSFDEFCASFGIQRKSSGRRSLSAVVAQQMQGKPSRVTTKLYHSGGESSFGSVKAYLEDDLIAMWKRLRKDARFDNWTYKDTTQF